jgi:hypothetical protein
MPKQLNVEMLTQMPNLAPVQTQRRGVLRASWREEDDEWRRQEAWCMRRRSLARRAAAP